MAWLGNELPTRSVLGDEIYELLKARLMDNVVEPGARLSIDGLARDLGCSATPVREAMARLESDGLVVHKAHHGYTAAPVIDAHTFEELFTMRLLLEPACASWAAKAARPRQIAAMEDLVSEMRAPTTGSDYDDYKLFAAQDAAFHSAIATASGVGLMVETLERLRPHVRLYRLHYTAGIAEETVLEHQHVLDAIARRDETAAAEAMATHLRSARLRLEASLDQE